MNNQELPPGIAEALQQALQQPEPFNPLINLDVLDKLAKLLASEDLIVQHANTPTAYFNTEKRILTLPMWKNVSKSLYHMLVEHEVSHALHTDRDLWKDVVTKEPDLAPYINIVEDARIERKMKDRFPGTRADFREGYRDLHENRDFFMIKSKPRKMSARHLADRINLFFKIGHMEHVPFRKEESHFVTETEQATTFEQVVDIARRLMEFCKNPPEFEHDPNFDDNNTDEGEEGAQEQTWVTLEELTSNLIDNNTPSPVYIDIDTDVDPDLYVVPYTNLLEAFKRNVNAHLKCYTKMRRDNINVIDYLVKEFQVRKAAKQYVRAHESKTGIINPNKLHAYKLVDDIFKRSMEIPQAKNHGICMYIDFSGSMQYSMEQTIEQLLNLVLFCRKVNIPHRVYAFTDNYYGFKMLSDPSQKTHSVRERKIRARCDKIGSPALMSADANMHLLELFTERQRATEVATMFEGLLQHFNGTAQIPVLNLGGTPLDATVILAQPILKKFQAETNTEIVSTIFLTDGDSSGARVYSASDTVYPKRNGSNQIVIMRNRKTRKMYQLKPMMYYTDILLKNLSDMGYHTIGYRIVHNFSEIRLTITREEYSYNKRKQLPTDKWRKEYITNNAVSMDNICGYDQLNAFAYIRESKTSAFKADDAAKSKNDITKQYISSRNNKIKTRVVLAKFAQRISVAHKKEA